MREEGISSSGDPLIAPTPAASSAGASSPAVPTNVGSIDWLGYGQSSKAASVSRIVSRSARPSLSTSAGGSALGSSQPSCRPWERGDLLRRLSTFNPLNWSGKPKAASSLACARRGWVNVGVDKIECESCSANLKFSAPSTWMSTQAESAGEEFAKKLDGGHRINCPWRGNICAESLVQFPPTPPSALVGGYKDRCDGLLQFLSLPIVAASAIEQMKASRSLELERFLDQLQDLTVGDSGLKADVLPQTEANREEVSSVYTHAQKLISLCGWEPRWLPNIQDCEEHSAQSARNGYSVDHKDSGNLNDPGLGKKALSSSTKKDSKKKEVMCSKSNGDSRSPLLDCSLCGATVRILDFLSVTRPARFAPSIVDMPETSKKLALTRGASAASGINGWIAADGMGKEQTEEHDEAATADEGKSMSNVGVDLNLTMGGGLPSAQVHMNVVTDQPQEITIGRDLMIGQPSSSEVGDRAASYESRGPSTRKRNLEEGGSTVDRPQLLVRQADSVEGTVIDRDGDEVNDGEQYSAGPSKRSREAYAFETYQSSYRRDSSGAGPSRSLVFEINRDGNREDLYNQRDDQSFGIPSARDSARASSVIAMDTIGHSADDDSMESVENRPGDMDDVQFPMAFRNPDLNETSELNYSNQAQQSVCLPAVRGAGDVGVSSTNEEEVLNTDTTTARGRDGPSFGISGGSVGMGASHEAEIHGADLSVHRADSVVGDMEPVAEVTENQGQTGEFAPDPGLMGDYVPQEMDREYPHGDSQDLMSGSVARADSGSKVVGSGKVESVESGEKTSDMHLLPNETSNHPSHSCNAILCSGYEASKEEVTQAGKASPTNDSGYPKADDMVANGKELPNGESNYEEAVEFDPIKHHNYFCPWVNGNVAAAGSSSNSGSGSGASAIALCGWQLTLDALDSFQSLGQAPVQTVESESAASLCKDDQLTPGRKFLALNSFSRSHGLN
ncbi:hypothetical protein DCAR_0522469 [Daucus carota subsp. sativus]|uniref:Uncharacterized protein n=1 Tax=Daucus carota subsp. sativus TaxID=79200 RepID=A0A164ZU39_DAUCS|nr:PREDICTED: uncharacterized protein LOC108222941 [Daucus carota subsp. sativus]WOH03077.1 hypothetical protein DCAR_0522469 [Daucus carota subsp. sativus]